MAKGEWYYCLDHHTVEPYEACRSASRLGPYPTPADAANALELVEARNTDWQNDPRFNEDAEDDEEAEPEEQGWGPFQK